MSLPEAHAISRVQRSALTGPHPGEVRVSVRTRSYSYMPRLISDACGTFVRPLGPHCLQPPHQAYYTALDGSLGFTSLAGVHVLLT